MKAADLQLPLFAASASSVYYVRFPEPIPTGEFCLRGDWLKSHWPGVTYSPNGDCIDGGSERVKWRITPNGVAIGGSDGWVVADTVGKKWPGSRVEEVGSAEVDVGA